MCAEQVQGLCQRFVTANQRTSGFWNWMVRVDGWLRRLAGAVGTLLVFDKPRSAGLSDMVNVPTSRPPTDHMGHPLGDEALGLEDLKRRI